jgi:hypothetical protein
VGGVESLAVALYEGSDEVVDIVDGVLLSVMAYVKGSSATT